MLYAAAAESAERASLVGGHVIRVRPQSSVLTDAHNQGWATALSQKPRPDYFAQQHSDVVGEPGWLDILLEEIEKHEADLVSAAVAIKDTRGLTSTTVFDLATGKHRRITMRELMELPETFSVEDVPWAPHGSVLCTNTGLWACKFGPWCEKVVFTIRDFISCDENGTWTVGFWPEDWQFAMDAARLGQKIMVTRRACVQHIGTFPFRNDRAWGSLEHDEWHTHPEPTQAVRPDVTTRKGEEHLGGYAIGGDVSTWAPVVWTALVAHYQAKTVVDVGAGEGLVAEWFAKQGCDVLALDGETRAVEQCRRRGLPTMQVDLAREAPTIPARDLAWCSEMVEHLDEDKLPNLAAAFASCRTVALTHALPGDIGHHHVNCRDSEYWERFMSQNGFRYDRDISATLRDIAPDSARCIKRSLMIFERAA